jgi:hypothetical protein
VTVEPSDWPGDEIVARTVWRHVEAQAIGSESTTAAQIAGKRPRRPYARRIRKLNLRSSRAWFGFGANSTYFWSP